MNTIQQRKIKKLCQQMFDLGKNDSPDNSFESLYTYYSKEILGEEE